MPKVLRFSHGAASCGLLELKKGVYKLSNLYSVELRQGHATAVIEKAIAYADEHNLVLKLEVRAYQHPDRRAMNNAQLESFYGRFGFVVETPRKPHPIMIRKPSQQKHAP